jgi:hypothetical protein
MSTLIIIDYLKRLGRHRGDVLRLHALQVWPQLVAMVLQQMSLGAWHYRALRHWQLVE